MISRILRMFRRSGALPPPCEEARMLSSDYIDGELEPALRQKIRAHLADCPLCAAFIETLRATIEALRGVPSQPVPDGFRRRLRQHIHEHGT